MKDYTPKTNNDTSLHFSNLRKSREALSKKTPDVPIRVIPSSSFSEDSSSKERKNGPIWLQLLVSENQGTDSDTPLPQLPTRYLRIKDGSMTISYVRDYTMQKLYVGNEDEIEIACMGQPLTPTMPVTDVVTTWLQATGTLSKITVTVGSLSKDFIMVLMYTRKSPAPAPMPPPSLPLLPPLDPQIPSYISIQIRSHFYPSNPVSTFFSCNLSLHIALV